MTIARLRDATLFKTQAYLNGQWVSADQGTTFPVSNPATGALLAEVADLGVVETRRAVTAATEAMPAWQAVSAKARSAILQRWQHLICEHAEDLATLITLEQGKPLAEARAEVANGAAFIQWFAEEGKRVYGDVLATPAMDQRGIVLKQPIGVVAAITPWNFPHSMIARKVGPALAVGCALVLKPAPETPLSALALAALAERAGVPAGLFNVVPGTDAAAIGRELTTHPDVRKVTFTGSTQVGQLLMQQSASTVKRTAMELGGNAPLIIFDDADLTHAVAGAMASKYRNAGQTCICANRLLVQAGIYEDFVAALQGAVQALQLGNGLEASTTQGPLISEQAVAAVHAKVQQAVAAGATVVTGGQPSALGPGYYEPTILTGVQSDMQVFQAEIFGPVAPIVAFNTEQEAIQMANDTAYGLAAYVYTQQMARAWRVAEQVEYGMVGLNETAISSEMMPFGGIKASGQGREGSKYGLEDYLETKYISLGGLGYGHL